MEEKKILLTDDELEQVDGGKSDIFFRPCEVKYDDGSIHKAYEYEKVDPQTGARGRTMIMEKEAFEEYMAERRGMGDKFHRGTAY